MPQRAKTGLIALFGYTAISFGYFGWRLLPHPGRVLVGHKHDPVIIIWSFAWWPHAIAHWTNPFVTHVLYAPTGVNLTWAASVPLLALAFSPVTALFGPVVAYNVAAIVLPALAAWTAYLLCRHLTRSVWASAVGGYLFGFSSYILGQQREGHLHLTGVFLLPLVALAVVHFVAGELTARGLTWRLGLLVGLQVWISTELAVTLTFVLACGLGLAFWLLRDARPRLRSSLLPIAAGYGVAFVVAAPLIVFLAIGFLSVSFSDARNYGTDLLNVALPTHLIGLGGSTFSSVSGRFPGADTEPAGYLGWPALLVVAAFATRARRIAGARFLLAALAVCVVVALGTALEVDGHKLIPLPWVLAVHVPGLDNALPARFAVYVSLAAAVIVAFWTATTRGRVFARPYLLPVLAVLALVPAVWQPLYRSQPERQTFFTAGLDKTCLQPNETVAIFPFGYRGDSLLWQAESGFRFRLAEGELHAVIFGSPPLTGFEKDPVVQELEFDFDYARPTMDELLAFAGAHHVDRILSVASHGYPNAKQMRAFGPVEHLGGMLIAPACGQPSLAKRNLAAFVTATYASIRSGGHVLYCRGLKSQVLPSGMVPAGSLAGETPANYVTGPGLTCAPPPAGYVRHGFATAAQDVQPGLYPFYSAP